MLLLVFRVTQFKVDQNVNQNRYNKLYLKHNGNRINVLLQI